VKQVLIMPALEIIVSAEGLSGELATLMKEAFAEEFMPKISQK